MIGWELVAVGLVIAIFFLFGPRKLPEFAKAIGQARRAFEEAKNPKKD